MLLLWSWHNDCCVCWIWIQSTVCSSIVLIQFGFRSETFTACSARIRLITSMQSAKIDPKWVIQIWRGLKCVLACGNELTSYALLVYVFAKTLCHKRYTSEARVHECVHDWPTGIFSGTLHRSRRKRTDSTSRGNANAWSNDFPGQNFRHIRRKHMDVRQHGIYCA